MLRHSSTIALVAIAFSLSRFPALGFGGSPAPQFSKPVDYDPELTGAQYVVVGDVLHRGIEDLVVTHANDSFGHISLLVGNGDGTFARAKIVYQGTRNNAVLQARLADANGDGIPDLIMVTTDLAGVAYLTVALGDGHGRFHQAGQTRFNDGPLVIGKFGSDRLPDVFVQASYAVPAAIYRSNKHGGFSSVQLPYGGGAGGLIAVDVNHDGNLDLVGIGQSPSLAYPEQLQTLIGTGNSYFFLPPIYTRPSLEESQSTGNNTGITAAAGDLRGTGNLDLIVFGSDFQYGLTIGGSVYFGHPDGSFDPPLLLPLSPKGGLGTAGNGAAIADFNGDGIADIFLTTNASLQPTGTFVLSGAGDGTFPLELQTLVPIRPLYPHVIAADLNNDSRPDAIVSDQTSNRGVWVLLNTATRTRVPNR